MHPKTPTQAIAWEIYRVSRLETLARLGGLLALLFAIFPFVTLTDALAPFVRGMAMAFLMSTSVFSATWISSLDNRNVGYSFHLSFTKPVTTRRLVGVSFLMTMLTSMLVYIVPATCARLVFGLQLPLLAPLAIVVCIVAMFLCVVWSPATIAGRLIGVTGVAAVLVTSLVHLGRHFSEPGINSLGRLELFALPAWGYALLAAVIAVSFAVTVYGVDRQRHGKYSAIFGFESFRRRFSAMARSSATSHRARRPFRGPLHAQFWYEMRRSGYSMLLIACVAASALFALVSLLIAFGMPREKSAGMWLAVLVIVPIVLQMIGVGMCGQLRRTQGAGELSKFDAVRSLRNDQLILLKLLVITVASLGGWLMFAAAAALQTAFWQTFERWRQIADVLTPLFGGWSLWWLAGSASLVWMFLSSAAMIIAFNLWFLRHPRLFVAAAVIVYAHAVLAMIDYRHGWTLAPLLWKAYAWLIGVGMMLVCLWSIHRALRSGALSPKYFLVATGLWLVYVVTVAMLVRESWAILPPIPLAAAPPAVGGLLLSLAATAVAPLSLAAHRHQ